LGVVASASAAGAQTLTFAIPVVDRWMYPFASGAGSRPTAPAFSSLNTCGTDTRFDDRDAQFYVCFDTSTLIAPGADPSTYNVESIRLTLTVNTDVNTGTPFQYDPTEDAIATFFAPGDAVTPCPADPAFIPDADAGRPIELFAVAYRNGFSALTYGETSPFKPGNQFTPPWVNVRNAYPIGFDSVGEDFDASNPVKARTSLPPLALGTIPGASPGDFPADGAAVTFDLAATNPGVRAYFQTGLAQGRVALLIAGLSAAEQQVVGSYPTFYTKEAVGGAFPAAAAPRLEVTLASTPLCPADFDQSGFVNPDDLADFIAAYFTAPPDPRTDFDGSGIINPDDLADFIAAYFTPCP
jgi:hypothetical protein